MTCHGVIMAQIPPLNSTAVYTGLNWIVSVLMTRVETLWHEIATNIELHTSQWHGWMLVYLTSNLFNEGNRRQGQNDPFKQCHMSNIEQFVNKTTIDGKLDSYWNSDNIFCSKLEDENGEIETIDDFVDKNKADIVNSRVVILYNFYYESLLQESFYIGDIKFELRTIIGITNDDDFKWDGVIFSRHGGYYSKWWKDKRNQEISLQIDELPNNLDYHDWYTLAYVQVVETDVNSLRDNFLKNIGGQTHVQCRQHNLPLIPSLEREGKCVICNNKEYYRCCEFSCKCFLCKKCFDKKRRNTTTYVDATSISDINDEASTTLGEEINYVENDNDEAEDNCTDDANNDDANNDDNECNFIRPEEETDNFDEFGDCDDIDAFLTTAQEPAIPFDEENTNNVDMIPTTNQGQLARTIEETSEYAGTFGNIKISGHVMLNQCGTLLTRKRHQIKPSSRHKFFLHKAVATCPSTTVPLMYPEGVLFPSIHWKMAPDKCSILGCIPASLLTEINHGNRFASIQSHIRSRVNNLSSTTSSDYRYVLTLKI